MLAQILMDRHAALRARFADATVAGLAGTVLEDAERRPAIEQRARSVLRMTATSGEAVERKLRDLRAAAT